ncbi:hypothetical protein KL905_004837 [Ogataea polymorpha]|uniref:Uncharacterized protein n=1 Tax=Ogataea polymorpha TaxID=460523 RepID=A0A1B7SDJ9_9ASCO|nr:uncharacterized protein OGAPODRAFT_10072 [Ogataea polymorpha]KAG7877575.1 hypothetical protein KL937_004770 [Ogataea polymorpha]KAG7886983.1 hypothetical protein KL936_004834 [Ogataea polymorpha]KAG7889094.1 hypothetical protein KL908_004894 [Ogataea polymorpha]KAG7897915.1 hypothetical protein KL935_004790 [Ogataea polymorpha]KAG7900013.1 hypothetical protein KL907_004775 [Ogataea polymorpha]
MEKQLADTNLYESLVETKSLEQLRNNPDSLLSTIRLFDIYPTTDPSCYEHLHSLVPIFCKRTPGSVMLLGSEMDFGYSLIYLGNLLRKTDIPFVLHGLFDYFSLTEDNRKLIEYLVDLSGISQIKVHFAQDLEDYLIYHPIHADWILVNHISPQNDITILRTMESVSLVQPGTVVARVNCPAECRDKFYEYLLGAPVYKRTLNEHIGGRKQGRWNLIYEKIADTYDKYDPMLTECVDLLNA